MNSEQARKNLDSKLSEKGYSHPEKIINSNSPLYMQYNAEEKTSETYTSVQNYDIYQQFDGKDYSKPKPILDMICPICSKKAKYSCNCSYKEKMCENKHKWYYEKEELKIGDPHLNEKVVLNNIRR